MILRPLTETDSYEELTSLLHRSYGQLASVGLNFFASHQSVEDTRHRCESGECFVIEQDGDLIATITAYHDKPNSDCAYYRDPQVWYFGQFAVEPQLQHRGIGLQLLEHVEEFARQHGARQLMCDTAETAHGLIAYYARQGFAQIGFQRWPEVNYQSVVLMKSLHAG